MMFAGTLYYRSSRPSGSAPADGGHVMAVSSATVVDITRIPAGEPALPRHLVVGVDGTPSSLRAVDLAATVARRNESEVTVAFIRHFPLFTGTVVVDWSAVFASLEAEVTEAARQRLAGVRWRLVVSDGAPALALERIVTEVGGDLLVVGQSQGGPIHRLLDGSVGGHAASHAPVPVLVAR
jgi:nucleotide-binding universal stress UspA family protein